MTAETDSGAAPAPAIQACLAGRNVSMDFFRGVMAMIVCIGHLYLSAPDIIKIPCSFTLAVDFFLVLSGFVICHSVTKQGAGFDSVRFAKQRFLRLFPVYIACILLFFPIFAYFHLIEKIKFFDIVRIVTISEMLPFNPRSGFSMEGALGHCWTISAELYAGIIFFPVYAFLLPRGKMLIFPLGLVILIWTGLILNNSYGYFGENWSIHGNFFCLGMLRCIFDYTIGILSYALFIRRQSVPQAQSISILQLGAVAACLLLYGHFQYHHHNDIFAPFLFAFFITLLAFRRGIIYRCAANKIGVFFGDISYPLYIIHPLLLVLLRLPQISLNHFPKALVIFTYCAVSIVSAWLINRAVEKPCLKLLRAGRPAALPAA